MRLGVRGDLGARRLEGVCLQRTRPLGRWKVRGSAGEEWGRRMTCGGADIRNLSSINKLSCLMQCVHVNYLYFPSKSSVNNLWGRSIFLAVAFGERGFFTVNKESLTLASNRLT